MLRWRQRCTLLHRQVSNPSECATACLKAQGCEGFCYQHDHERCIFNSVASRPFGPADSTTAKHLALVDPRYWGQRIAPMRSCYMVSIIRNRQSSFDETRQDPAAARILAKQWIPILLVPKENNNSSSNQGAFDLLVWSSALQKLELVSLASLVPHHQARGKGDQGDGWQVVVGGSGKLCKSTDLPFSLPTGYTHARGGIEFALKTSVADCKARCESLSWCHFMSVGSADAQDRAKGTLWCNLYVTCSTSEQYSGYNQYKLVSVEVDQDVAAVYTGAEIELAKNHMNDLGTEERWPMHISRWMQTLHANDALVPTERGRSDSAQTPAALQAGYLGVLRWVKDHIKGQPTYGFDTELKMELAQGIADWLKAHCAELAKCTDHRSTSEGRTLLARMDPQLRHWFVMARLARVWHLYTKALGVPYTLSDGTLLGAVRHRQTMQPEYLGFMHTNPSADASSAEKTTLKTAVAGKHAETCRCANVTSADGQGGPDCASRSASTGQPYVTFTSSLRPWQHLPEQIRCTHVLRACSAGLPRQLFALESASCTRVELPGPAHTTVHSVDAGLTSHVCVCVHACVHVTLCRFCHVTPGACYDGDEDATAEQVKQGYHISSLACCGEHGKCTRI